MPDAQTSARPPGQAELAGSEASGEGKPGFARPELHVPERAREAHRALVRGTAESPVQALGKHNATRSSRAPSTAASPVQALGKNNDPRLAISAPDLRPRAPWSDRSAEMVARALAASHGLTLGEKISTALSALLEENEAQGARISLVVRDPSSTSPLFANEAAAQLNPASNSKLATAAFALEVLGPEHRFTTEIRRDRGGNICVAGGFDPSMTFEDLVTIAGELAAHTRAIDGDIVLDMHRLRGPRVPAGFAGYGDQDWAYLAPVGPLSVDKNLLEVTVRPGAREGEPAGVALDQTAFEVRSTVTTAAPKAQFKIGCDEADTNGALTRNDRGQAVINVWGDIAADYAKGKTLIMKSPDPVASFADRLVAALECAKIRFTGKVREGVAPIESELVHAHRSAPLSELLRESIATSNAFDHETYALAAALAASGRDEVTLEDAMKELERFLRAELGVSATMKNGSGIGNLNLLSANDVTEILARACRDDRYRPLLDGLARPGFEGTLLTRMLGTPAERALAAKTGTGENSVALSGVVRQNSGDPIVFSVLVNDHTCPRSGARAFADAVGVVLSSLVG